MAPQQMDHQLLLGLLAVQRGLITAGQLQDFWEQPGADRLPDWLDVATEKQLLSPTNVRSLEHILAVQLAQHAGDVSAFLRASPISDELRQCLQRLNRPEIDVLLDLANPDKSSPLPATDAHGEDHYGTIVSRSIEIPSEPADPYSTGAYPSSSDAVDLDEAQSQSPLSASASSPAQTGGTAPSMGAGPPSESFSGTSQAATAADPTAAQADSLPAALQGTEAIDHQTYVPSSSPISSAEQPTLIPDPDYSTLRSDLAGSGTAIDESERTGHSGGLTASVLRFRVLREHAKGGLGKVSVAEDLELHREVAFKEIQHRFADDTEARSRFLLEAEITGSLEHPGIVPVYGLGTHPDGRPYYAMRFIRGNSLQQAIDNYFEAESGHIDPGARQVEFRKLLRRFIDVCNAMDYAHSRGIIHRDLKPGNVMLGDYGETLVVDWGIAKSIAVRSSVVRSAVERLPQLTLAEGSQTMMGAAIGTPQFMSPEQAEGKLNELGPASDIYSLGATLYCVLTGVPAFTSRKLLEILQNVKSGTFPPPIEINPSVPKPLNAICLKAMNRLPALRYESAKALAGDIESWLADEPVMAYPENRWERISRWIRRHQARAQAAAVAVIVIAVVSVMAAILIDQSRRAEALALSKLAVANQLEIAARKQETLAKQEALRRSKQTREAVDTLLSGMSEALDAFPGMHDARRRLLERAAQDYSRLAQENSKDPELQAEAARSLVRLADVYSKLNSLDKARAALGQADEIFQHQLHLAPHSPEFRLELAITNTRRGLLEAAAGKYSVAIIYFQSAIDSLDELAKTRPPQVSEQDALGTALIGIGQAEQHAGKSQDAARHLQRSLSIFQDLRTAHPEDVRVLIATAAAESAYARFLLDTGRAAEAAQIFNEAILAHDALVDEFPAEPEYFAQRATARINLAEALRGLGRWNVVVRNYDSSVSDLQEVVRARPDVPLYRENLAIARTNLGQARRKLGSNTESVPVLEKALENFDELSASYPLPRYIEGIGNTRASLAQVLSELGQQDQAIALINTAIDDYRELLDLHPDSATYQEGLGIVQSNRGRILARRGDLPGGVQAFEAAIASLKSAAEKDPETGRITDQLAWAWTHFGHIQFAAGQTQPSRDAFQSAITIRQALVLKFKASIPYQDSLAWLLATCPVVELRDGKRALELSNITTTAIPDSPQHRLTQGAAHLALGEYAAAVTACDTSLKLRGQDEGLTLCLRALAEAKLKQPQLAQSSLTAAKAWQQSQKPADEELSFWIKQAVEAVEKPPAM